MSRVIVYLKYLIMFSDVIMGCNCFHYVDSLLTEQTMFLNTVLAGCTGAILTTEDTIPPLNRLHGAKLAPLTKDTCVKNLKNMK